MSVTGQPPRGHGITVAGAPVVMQLSRPAGAR
jgi:hypothetical protein